MILLRYCDCECRWMVFAHVIVRMAHLRRHVDSIFAYLFLLIRLSVGMRCFAQSNRSSSITSNRFERYFSFHDFISYFSVGMTIAMTTHLLAISFVQIKSENSQINIYNSVELGDYCFTQLKDFSFNFCSRGENQSECHATRTKTRTNRIRS